MDKNTFKNTAIGLIPSDWEIKKLGNLGKTFTGLSGKNKDDFGEGFQYIPYKNIFQNSIIDISFMDLVKIKPNETQSKVKYGDLFFTTSSETAEEVGMCSVLLEEVENMYLNSFCFGFRFDDFEILDPKFSSYLFRGEQIRQEITVLAQGSTRFNLSKSELQKLKIPIPPLLEQQKIASILSTWDVAIDNCKAVIEELKVRNKGLTQKLFAGDFERKHLSEIFERVTTKNSEKNQNVITISAQRGFIKQTDFFNKIIASDILDHYTLVKKGDFCYNKSYSNGYDWGATKRLNDFEKAVVTTLYICFRLKDENQNSGNFFEYYFESGILYKGLSKVANEGGRAHGLLNVTSSDFFNIKIGVPTFEEQKAIASILDKATEGLNQYQQKLQALQLQKKGLMQQLLTGKVRVKT